MAADSRPSPPPPSSRSTANAPAAPGRPARSWRRRGCFLLVALVLLGAGGFALYTWAALRFSYSQGERAGYIQKFSKKGWICKTWEGELAMVSLPGALPEVFPFSVRDEAVAQRIQASLGQRVSLTYEEHLGLPTSCFGETAHFATGVRRVEP